MKNSPNENRSDGMTPCIILAGGQGTRLRDSIGELPKCLAPINNSPFLLLQLNQLKETGLNSFILALGYKSEMVISEISKDIYRKFNLSYIVEQSPLGTGGAIRNVLEKSSISETVVINGDSLLTGSLHKLISVNLERSNAKICIGCVEVQETTRYGKVLLDRNNKVLSFSEKEDCRPGVINAGIYKIRSTAFAKIPDQLPCSLEMDVLPALAQAGELQAVRLEGSFIDIGTPKSLNQLRECQSAT